MGTANSSRHETDCVDCERQKIFIRQGPVGSGDGFENPEELSGHGYASHGPRTSCGISSQARKGKGHTSFQMPGVARSI
jgi:hypothetical protein